MEWPHRLGAIQMRVSAIKWGDGGRGGKCHKNQGAAARPSRRITAAVKWMWKQEKALRNIDLMLQPEQGGRCALQITCALFPTHREPWVPLPPHSREPERERLRGDVPFLCLLPSALSSMGKNKQRLNVQIQNKQGKTHQVFLDSEVNIKNMCLWPPNSETWFSAFLSISSVS